MAVRPHTVLKKITTTLSPAHCCILVSYHAVSIRLQKLKSRLAICWSIQVQTLQKHVQLPYITLPPNLYNLRKIQAYQSPQMPHSVLFQRKACSHLSSVGNYTNFLWKARATCYSLAHVMLYSK